MPLLDLIRAEIEPKAGNERNEKTRKNPPAARNPTDEKANKLLVDRVNDDTETFPATEDQTDPVSEEPDFLADPTLIRTADEAEQWDVAMRNAFAPVAHTPPTDCLGSSVCSRLGPCERHVSGRSCRIKTASDDAEPAPPREAATSPVEMEQRFDTPVDTRTAAADRWTT